MLKSFLCRLGLLCLSVAVVSAPVDAQSNGRAAALSGGGAVIEVHVGEGRMLHLGQEAANVMVGNSTIADVQAVTNQEFYVYGRQAGLTTLTATNAANGVAAQMQLLVTRGTDLARRALAADASSVDLSFINNRLVIGGHVNGLGAAVDAMAAARAFNGDSVPLDRTQLAGAQQVTLRVRIAEVSRSSLNQLGLSLDLLAQPGSFAFSLMTGGLVGSAVSTAAGLLSGSGGSSTGAGTSTNGGASTSTFATTGVGVTTGRVNAGALLNALQSEGLMTSLAEPNLTTISGETATFLSGGEVPIPVPQGLGETSIEYKNYGVQLSFTPVILPGERIAMKVKPEVSEISSGTSYTINGSSVPAFLTRSAETNVEMASGQTLAIAGLFQRVDQQSISKFPFLGDIPVIGAIFRSSSYQHDETELVILVTPYLTQPVAAASAYPLPTDRPPSAGLQAEAGFTVQ